MIINRLTLLLYLMFFIYLSKTIAQWENVHSSYGSGNCFALSDNNIYSTTEKGFIVSTDQGSSWKTVNPGITTYNTVYSIAVNEKNIFLGTTSNGILHSSDNGKSWTEVNKGLFSNKWIYSLTFYGTTLFAGTCGGLYISTDNGINWLGQAGIFGCVKAFAFNNSTIYVGTDLGIYISTDNGSVWNRNNSGLIEQDANAIVIKNENVFVGNHDGIYLWSDVNKSWNYISKVDSSADAPEVSALAVIGNNLIAGLNKPARHILLSTNNGVDWNEINTGFTDHYVYALAVMDSNIFAGTGGSIWRRSISEITQVGELEDNKTLSGFSLIQNFPNPFNPTTKIKYSVIREIFVKINVYDMLGREIETLVSEEKPIGNYEIEFDGRNLSSGVYFYKMKAGSFTDIKKFILMK